MEYKFRARDLKYDKWVENDETPFAYGFHVIGEVTMFDIVENYCYSTVKKGESGLSRLGDIELTMSSCLLDENNETEIYENDILKNKELNVGLVKLGYYKEFDNHTEHYGFYIEWVQNNGQLWVTSLWGYNEKSKVIGNYYENKNKLEVPPTYY